jgi:hypothetical protein
MHPASLPLYHLAIFNLLGKQMQLNTEDHDPSFYPLVSLYIPKYLPPNIQDQTNNDETKTKKPANTRLTKTLPHYPSPHQKSKPPYKNPKVTLVNLRIFGSYDLLFFVSKNS